MMRILVSGSSGFIGASLVPSLERSGYQVVRLMRSQPQSGEAAIQWDPAAGMLRAEQLEGCDAVVHLAGENIVGRWTQQQKAKIRESRVRGTDLLAQMLARCSRPPRVLVSASATGYYGDRGDVPLHEDSFAGIGFLSDVCREWEAATAPAASKGIRVVHVRLGLVLSPQGGALAKMLLPFRLGLGGIIGHGRQYWSWVTIRDVLGAIRHAITTDALHGAVNVTAPQPVTNREFTTVLGRLLRRPTICPVPAFGVRLLFGEMADALLLSSTRVKPKRLLDTGYVFQDADLESALHHLLPR